MTVTLSANYKEVFSAETVEKIEELMEDNYELSDMLEFIDERNENWFVKYYEEYVRCGEAIGYDAVDALIDEMGSMDCVENCAERYRGQYSSTAEFAEEFTYEVYGDVPSFVVVDWDATYDQNLYYDFTACEAGYRTVYIFSDN